jgi:hypothetical protein
VGRGFDWTGMRDRIDPSPCYADRISPYLFRATTTTTSPTSMDSHAWRRSILALALAVSTGELASKCMVFRIAETRGAHTCKQHYKQVAKTRRHLSPCVTAAAALFRSRRRVDVDIDMVDPLPILPNVSTRDAAAGASRPSHPSRRSRRRSDRL